MQSDASKVGAAFALLWLCPPPPPFSSVPGEHTIRRRTGVAVSVVGVAGPPLAGAGVRPRPRRRFHARPRVGAFAFREGREASCVGVLAGPVARTGVEIPGAPAANGRIIEPDRRWRGPGDSRFRFRPLPFPRLDHTYTRRDLLPRILRKQRKDAPAAIDTQISHSFLCKNKMKLSTRVSILRLRVSVHHSCTEAPGSLGSVGSGHLSVGDIKFDEHVYLCTTRSSSSLFVCLKKLGQCFWRASFRRSTSAWHALAYKKGWGWPLTLFSKMEGKAQVSIARFGRKSLVGA